MWNDSIEHHDIGNRSKHRSRGICFRTLFEPICMGRHRPDIANQRSFRDGDTTRYASPRVVKMISTLVNKHRPILSILSTRLPWAVKFPIVKWRLPTMIGTANLSMHYLRTRQNEVNWQTTPRGI